jgi:hypothetical protein
MAVVAANTVTPYKWFVNGCFWGGQAHVCWICGLKTGLVFKTYRYTTFLWLKFSRSLTTSALNSTMQPPGVVDCAATVNALAGHDHVAAVGDTKLPSCSGKIRKWVEI